MALQKDSLPNRNRKRRQAMAWSFLFIVLSAMILPAVSYLVPTDTAHAQVVNDQNQRANFWRAVREGNEGRQLLRYNFFMLQADVLPNMGFSATRKRLIRPLRKPLS